MVKKLTTAKDNQLLSGLAAVAAETEGCSVDNVKCDGLPYDEAARFDVCRYFDCYDGTRGHFRGQRILLKNGKVIKLPMICTAAYQIIDDFPVNAAFPPKGAFPSATHSILIDGKLRSVACFCHSGQEYIVIDNGGVSVQDALRYSGECISYD